MRVGVAPDARIVAALVGAHKLPMYYGIAERAESPKP